MLREHTVLTDAARDAAELLGIRLVEGSTYSTATPTATVAAPARPGAGGLPSPALGGLTRGVSSGAAGRREPRRHRPAPGRAGCRHRLFRACPGV